MVINYKNEDLYVGEMLRGKRSGIGSFVYDNNKSMYEGEWLNDMRNGIGTQITTEGTYKGFFVK